MWFDFQFEAKICIADDRRRGRGLIPKGNLANIVWMWTMWTECEKCLTRRVKDFSIFIFHYNQLIIQKLGLITLLLRYRSPPLTSIDFRLACPIRCLNYLYVGHIHTRHRCTLHTLSGMTIKSLINVNGGVLHQFTNVSRLFYVLRWEFNNSLCVLAPVNGIYSKRTVCGELCGVEHQIFEMRLQLRAKPKHIIKIMMEIMHAWNSYSKRSN